MKSLVASLSDAARAPLRALVVIGLVGAVLHGCGGPSSADAQARIRADLRHLELALRQYAADKGGYPDTLAELVRPGAVYPRTEPRAELPRDPWGRPYEYVAPLRGNRFQLRCLGADGVRGGQGADADVELASLKLAAR